MAFDALCGRAACAASASMAEGTADGRTLFTRLAAIRSATAAFYHTQSQWEPPSPELLPPVRTTADLLDDESAQELGGDNSFATLRRHLSSLRLQTLLLPIGFKQALGQGLRTALAVLPSGLASDPPPLLVQWASSLTHLRCEIALDSEDALFTAFATSPWPQLRKLQLTMRCLCWCVFPVPSPHAIAVASLARALSSRNAPGLTSLELNLDCRSRSRWAKNLPPCPCDNVWQQLLPSVRSLTELRISIGLLRPSMALLEFLQLICTDAMPLLQRLVWGSGQLQPIDAVDHPLMISFLQRMRSLTSIHAVGGLVRSSRGPVKCFELLHHVHDLPSLRDVCADGAQWGVRSERGVGGCAVEVADVRQLESLTCAAVEVMPLLQRWWRHLGRPELRVNGELVAPHKWEEHVAQRTAREAASTASVGIPVATGAESMARQQLPAIRRLKLCASSLRQIRYEFTSPIAFSYLGRLPHLRELDCFVHVWYLDALASMTQLESLTLTLSDEWSSERKAQWNDEMVRTLGGMPLQRLHTLRLEGSNESDATNVYRSARPQDSDFPWGDVLFPTSDDDVPDYVEGHSMYPERATFAHVTLAGLRHLLKLRALTSLSLPWIEPRELDAFRILVEETGRTTLHVERITPLSHRTLVQRHWMTCATLDEQE